MKEDSQKNYRVKVDGVRGKRKRKQKGLSFQKIERRVRDRSEWKGIEYEGR